MIQEWDKGCSCSGNDPIECRECTKALIEAIRQHQPNDPDFEFCEQWARDNS